MVEPPVVTPETEEDACSLKCGVGECTIQKGGFSGRQKNFVNALMDISSSPVHVSKAKCKFLKIIKRFVLWDFKII